MGKGGKGEELVVRKRLKVFIGALPQDVRESEVGNHFAKYGHVIQVIVVPAKDGKAPYAFATYKFAADADCAVTEPQHFPGCQRALNMGFAAPKGNDAKKRLEDDQNDDACKVFVGGITDQDAEDQVGDFFSQWGLVVLVYRDRQWAFVTFATKEAAMRLLDEGSVIFQRRRLDVKPSDSKNTMQSEERNELIKRAVARHFHKKTVAAAPPAASYPPQPQYHHPPPGQAHYPPPHGQGPPPGYPPAHYPPPDGGHYGAPQGAPPPGYSPAPTYPPPGQAQPPAGHYGAPPPGAAADPYGARPSAAPPGGPPGHYPPPGGHYGAPPGHALTDYHHGAPAPEAYARDPYGHPPPHSGAPQHGAPPGPGAPPDYYRDSRGGAPPPDGAGGYYRDAPPQDPYGRAPGGPPPPAYRPY